MRLISVFNAHRRYRIRKKNVVQYVRRIVGKRNVEITVAFIDSRYIKSINQRYLNHNYVTDVISFVIERVPVLQGELYVNLDRAKHQAREYAVSFTNEVARLVIHGTLHLIGYSDETKSDREIMKTIEDEHVRHWFPEKQRKNT